jgi:hypothetical protein
MRRSRHSYFPGERIRPWLEFQSTIGAAVVFCVTTLLFSPVGHCQSNNTQAASTATADASSLLGQLNQAFSGGELINDVQLTGTATWYGGATPDTGTVLLKASKDGSSQVTLVLSTAGQRVETQSAPALGATCQWQGADAVQHAIRSGACWRPVIWFLPALSLQPTVVSASVGAADLGTAEVGAAETSLRHLQVQLVFADTDIMPEVTRQSTTDIGLSPTSFLPAVLAYKVRPDDGEETFASIEIRFSDYRTVNGVTVPFQIDRLVNGANNLDIQIASVAVN